MNRRDVLTRAAAVTAILGVFFAFAGDGLGGYFAPDEMMNLYRAWFPSLGELLHNDRPFGALVLRAMFGAFRLHPLPYRLLCFGLILANLALLYRFCKLATGSAAAAALACLLGAYHAHLADLYYASATIYDLLCCFFFFAVLTWYMAVRFTPVQTGCAVLLYVCALGSKEMAVTLPVFLWAYDALYRKTKIPRSAFFWISLPMTLAFMAYKTIGPGRMTLNPEYQPHFSLRVFLGAWKHYLADLFYGAVRFNDFKVAALLLGLLAVALLLRRRELLLAWCVIVIGALPVLFIVPRGFFAIYLTLPGWYLYAAALAPRRIHPSVVFAAVALILIPLHRHEKPLGNSWVPGAFAQTRPMIEQLAARYPKLPRGAKVLFLTDPWEPHDYLPYFLFALQYNDKDIRVDRMKDNPPLAPRYDVVFP